MTMKEEVTKFLVSFAGQIEYVQFGGGIFEDLYIRYEMVWGPDWSPISGVTDGTSQMARSGNDGEKVVFNIPYNITFSSTNVYGWPQLVITVRTKNFFSGDTVRGYGLLHMPLTAGPRRIVAALSRPQAATLFGEWISWITGVRPELVDPKMLASGKDNYLLRMESYGTVVVNTSMVSKDLRKLGYDNQPPLAYFTMLKN